MAGQLSARRGSQLPIRASSTTAQGSRPAAPYVRHPESQGGVRSIRFRRRNPEALLPTNAPMTSLESTFLDLRACPGVCVMAASAAATTGWRTGGRGRSRRSGRATAAPSPGRGGRSPTSRRASAPPRAPARRPRRCRPACGSPWPRGTSARARSGRRKASRSTRRPSTSCAAPPAPSASPTPRSSAALRHANSAGARWLRWCRPRAG